MSLEIGSLEIGRLEIAGLASAVPPHALSQADSAELHATFCKLEPEQARTLRALYRRSGVRRRHSVVLRASEGPLAERQAFYPPASGPDDRGPATAARMAVYEREAPALATRVARAALADARVCPSDVGHVVTVSCTGFTAPGIDARLVQDLGLPPRTARTHVGFMGCAAALNGLRVAGSLLAADPSRHVLVCSVELCSLHFSYGWDPEMMVANVLFADGAAAVVARAAGEAPSPGAGAAALEPPSGARPAPPPWRLADSATLLVPDSEEDMSWRIGDHGFRMTLSARVPELIAAHLGDGLRGWLAGLGLSAGDVGSWAVHPGGPRILSAVERALGLDPEQTRTSREVLAEHGNMSSATVLFVLERLRAEGAPLPCVAMALGPGLVAEAALFV